MVETIKNTGKQAHASETPRLSVVVVVFNMRREAPRTLLSLSPGYQQGISDSEYEVLIVENGSTERLDEGYLQQLPRNFRYFELEPPHPSPAAAVNFGMKQAQAPVIGVMLDGARVVTPGLLVRAIEAAGTHPRAIVATMGWYLGCDQQRIALTMHYNRGVEDQLLESIAWPTDGYRLFEIAVPDESSVDGWFSPIAESNALFMSRRMWDRLGGYDERFDCPGGGLVNLDTLVRATEVPGARLILLTEEATFHQAHGGIATNAPPDEIRGRIEVWHTQYKAIRGKPYDRPECTTYVYGGINRHMAKQFGRSLFHPFLPHRNRTELSLPGQPFNYDLWDSEHALQGQVTGSPGVKEVLLLARSCFESGLLAETSYICRLILNHQSMHPEAMRLLKYATYVEHDIDTATPQRRARYLLNVGRADLIYGNESLARERFSEALRLDAHCDDARSALAALNLPGPDYYELLERLHEYLRPSKYLEIGIFTGKSLARAKPPTQVVAVDPDGRILEQCSAEIALISQTSDDFFASDRAKSLLSGGIDIGFIDGLHEFTQVVRDFWNIERYCNNEGIIILHDTLPLDELSSEYPCRTRWWTGDVWKIVPFLADCRPDIEVFTVKVPPSGLTIVTNLNSQHAVSLAEFQSQAAPFKQLRWSEAEGAQSGNAQLVENDWNAVRSALETGKLHL